MPRISSGKRYARAAFELALEKNELEAERGKIVEDLRREFADIAISAAEKVIKETLDKERHRKLIEETLQESATFKKS